MVWAYVVVASRRQRELRLTILKSVRGAVRANVLFVLCHRDSSHYSVASRMTPERHDDVEDVVGRVGGDVTPEETHELSLLVALVEEDTARHVNTANVISVFGASTKYRNNTLFWTST